MPESKEPLSGKKYDNILVIVERLTKFNKYIPWLFTGTAKDLAYVIHKNITSEHGMPEEIISDRDSLLTSRFWKALMERSGTKHRTSTAFHPQTDGQTERMNQTLEQYLRCFINYKQDDWVEHLPIAQYAYNSAIHEATSMTPFYANYGFEPEITRHALNKSTNPRATTQVYKLRELQNALQQDLIFLQQRMKAYADEKRIEGLTL